MQYPGLSEILQPFARDAASLGLTLTQFNSGAKHPDNGMRLFVGAKADHFQGDHIAHLKTSSELAAFLNGYRLGRNSR